VTLPLASAVMKALPLMMLNTLSGDGSE